MGWVAVAAAAVSAISQIQQGQAAKNESKINAALMEGKAGLIDVQKDIEANQYNRIIGQQMGKSTVAIAGMGVKMSGSPMAVLLDSQKQIQLDKAIGQFNLEQQKRYTMAEADQIRRQGKQAAKSGYMNAFSSVLQGASSYASYKGWGTTSSFDTSGGAKQAGKV
jgi:hypothetical protein